MHLFTSYETKLLHIGSGLVCYHAWNLDSLLSMTGRSSPALHLSVDRTLVIMYAVFCKMEQFQPQLLSTK